MKASRRTIEEELHRLAEKFFASPPTPEEDQERVQWLEMSLETLRQDR